ncbi:MAG: LysR substrate-binding domain-containing protein [Pseudomonadota bacterium]
MISLKQLSYALAVAKTLHFKKAAEMCAVSQSTLSGALTEMEKQLGFQVFERDNKKVLITPLGEKVLEKAQSILSQVDDLHKLAEAQKAPLSYPFALGIIPTIGPYLLPKILPVLAEKYPNLKLRIVEEQSHVLTEMVRSGEIDTAILALPYATDGLLTFPFWDEEFYFVTYEDSMYSQRQVMTQEDFNNMELMLLRDGHCLKDHALAACHMSNESNHHLDATSLHTLVQLVANKMGSTLVPEMAIEPLVASNTRLKKIQLSEPGPHRRIAFIVRPNYPSVHNIELLIDLFKGQLANECC